MKNFLLSFILMSSSVLAHEAKNHSLANSKANGFYEVERHHPWPMDFLSIGHNMQSYQNYSMSPYWHDGLDIRGNALEKVYSTTSGEVVNIENYVSGNPLYWEVAIKDEEGLVWKYHHIDRQTIPKDLKVGQKITQGTFIGQIVKWPSSSFGEVFHHLHLLVVDGNGKYVNPFLLMKSLEDRDAPKINKIGLTKNHKVFEGNQIRGAHGIYVDTSDLALHTKYILPPHKMSYRLNGNEEVLVWEFVHLPSGKNDLDYIKDFYLNGTCGNYQCRKFLINLNFTQSSPRGVFNLPVGHHSVEVFVEDQNQNKSSQTFSWEVL